MIALIPAKGQSERITHKNRRLIAGKPLIAWTIESILQSSLIDEVYVSTDDLEIKEIALKYNCKIVRRPEHLCLPSTPLRPVIQHFLSICSETADYSQEPILVVLPTAALINPHTISEAHEKFFEREEHGRCVFGCSSYGHPIERSFSIHHNEIRPTFPSADTQKQTQKFEKKYHDSGTFYLGDWDFFMSSKTIFDGSGIPMILSSSEGLDIDWPEDLIVLEALLKNKKH